ncbi:MAG: hypothetical protein MJY56_07270, partial [Bacteroidales bacterium]|nr:hypothetical protein [Bacteroidales bacterium]
MKKATLYILLYIICGLLVLSCGHSGGNSSRTVVFRLEMPDGESFHWDEGYRDCFHIFENGVAPEDMIVDFTDGDVMLTLVYPASSATSFKYTGFINGRSSKNPAIGTEQKYDGESYDLSSDIMTVDPLVMYPGENESYLDLERVVAVSNVYVSGLGSGEHITSVTITSTNDISATYLLSSGSFNNGVKTMVARGKSATTPDGEAFSFVSIPTSSSKLSFAMTTTSRTLTLDRSVVLKAGMNAIFLDVEDGGPIGPATDAAGWLDLPALTDWCDLETQLRNALAEARGGERFKRPADGCSLYWKNRVLACFQEKDVARREELLARVWWDAAGAPTEPSAPPGA